VAEYALPHIADVVCLIAFTVGIHTAGTLFLLWIIFRYKERAERHLGLVHHTARLTAMVLAILVLHLTEVGIWAFFYYSNACFTDFQTATYFSLISYSGVGYGDVILKGEWFLLGGVESLTGQIMMSWSTVLMLGLLHWMYTRRIEYWQAKQHSA
jgi:hypothetical protein